MVYQTINKIDNETIIKIYDLYTCIKPNSFKWKPYKILALLDKLHQYNSDRYNDLCIKIDIYYDKHTLSNNIYPEAYNDFIKYINENIIDKNVGHSDYRKQLQFWINKNII
jgi:hypothetical protein